MSVLKLKNNELEKLLEAVDYLPKDNLDQIIDCISLGVDFKPFLNPELSSYEIMLKKLQAYLANKDPEQLIEDYEIDLAAVQNLINRGIDFRYLLNPCYSKNRVKLIIELLQDERYIALDINSYIDLYLPDFDQEFDEIIPLNSNYGLSIMKAIAEGIYNGSNIEEIFYSNLNYYKNNTLDFKTFEIDSLEKRSIIRYYLTNSTPKQN